MSAKDFMRDAIRELMAGTVLDFPSDQTEAAADEAIRRSVNEVKFETLKFRRLCFAFAVGACPAELLLNTKFSMGACRWLHDGALAKSVPMQDISRLELRALRIIDNALDTVDYEDRKQRRTLTAVGDVRASIEKHDLALEEAIRKLARRADAVAENGRFLRKRGLVGAYRKAMQEAERLEQSRMAIEERLSRRRSGRQQRFQNLPERLPLQECESCGLAYGLGGKSTRYSHHLNGRLHRSVVLLRQTSEALRAKYSIQTTRSIVGTDQKHAICAKKSRLDLASTLREDFEREEDFRGELYYGS